MYCSKCGERISEDSKFCKYCGYKVLLEDEESVISDDTKKSEEKSEKPIKAVKKMIDYVAEEMGPTLEETGKEIFKDIKKNLKKGAREASKRVGLKKKGPIDKIKSKVKKASKKK